MIGAYEVDISSSTFGRQEKIELSFKAIACIICCIYVRLQHRLGQWQYTCAGAIIVFFNKKHSFVLLPEGAVVEVRINVGYAPGGGDFAIFILAKIVVKYYSALSMGIMNITKIAGCECG